MVPNDTVALSPQPQYNKVMGNWQPKLYIRHEDGDTYDLLQRAIAELRYKKERFIKNNTRPTECWANACNRLAVFTGFLYDELAILLYNACGELENKGSANPQPSTHYMYRPEKYTPNSRYTVWKV